MHSFLNIKQIQEFVKQIRLLLILEFFYTNFYFLTKDY